MIQDLKTNDELKKQVKANKNNYGLLQPIKIKKEDGTK